MGDVVKEFEKPQLYIEKCKYIALRISRGLQCLLEWVPIKQNRISIIALTHNSYGDNLKYITELLRDKSGYEFAWITRHPELYGDMNGVRLIRARTWEHFMWQFTSRLLISDDYLYMGIRKRKKQTYLNTWHGGINYKRLGFEGMVFTTAFQEKRFRLQNEKPDYMIAGSRFFEENMKSAFELDDRTQFLWIGLPRNDCLFHWNEVDRKIIKERLGLTGQRLVLYAPTFRNTELTDHFFEIDFQKIREALAKRYGGEWTVLYRAHYFVRSDTVFEGKGIRNVSDYPDMQELLAISDYMISDYSSCMWDFLLTGKPCITYAPDYEYYRTQDRGFTQAGLDMPYPRAQTMEQLLALIAHYDEEREQEKNRQHQSKYGSYDHGSALESLAAWIQQICK